MATCPSCKSEFEITKKNLDSELLTMHITWGGDLVEAKTIGGLIENTRKLLAAAAREAGNPCDVFMQGIDWGDREAKFHFLLIAKQSQRSLLKEPSHD